MIKCPQCGRDNAPNFNFCLDCGYDLKAWREAFPGGAPAAPPPPAPAMTSMNPALSMPPSSSWTAGQPVQVPHILTPQSVQSPLPPAPGVRAPVDAPVFPPLPSIPSMQPPAFPPTGTPLPSMPSRGTPGPLPGVPAAVAPQSLPPSVPGIAPPSMPPSASPLAAAWGLERPSSPAMPAAPLSSPPTAAPSSTGVAFDLSALPAAVAPSSKKCGSCGYDNAPTVKFCGNCGKRIDGSVAPTAASVGESAGRTMVLHAATDVAALKEKVCKLVTIDQTGREGMTFTIKSGETICGRVNGVILFFDDPFVSPTHCRFSFLQGVLKVTDLNSLNGVYMRVKQERRLADGEFIRMGRQLFRFESMKMASFQVKKAEGDDSRIWGAPAPAAFGRLVQILDDGRTGEIRLLVGDKAQVGREVGDIVIPTDGFISGRHCVFAVNNGQPTLTDLGSSNGTYVRVRGEAVVAHGDFVLVGNQMLRVEII